MKLGIVSDIHEANQLLERALGLFRGREVDQVVALGDLFEIGPGLDRTVSMLAEAGAIGVYGNHDYGLAFPSDYHRERFSAPILDFMATLRDRIEVDGCLFAHREPWLDCTDVAQIWHVDEEPLTPGLLALSFAAAPSRRAIFVGHFHRWFAADPSGPLAWDGSTPLTLPGGSTTLVVVNAVCHGYAATFDTGSGELVPLDLYEGRARPACRPLPEGVSA